MKKQSVEELEGGIYEILKNLCVECYSRANGEFWKSYESLSKDSFWNKEESYPEYTSLLGQ